MAEEQVTATPVETGADTASADVETTATETDATQEVAEETPAEEQDSATEQTESEEESPEEPALTEEELAEFRGSAGARLREMYKQAPGLKELVDKYPKVRDQLGVLARRDAALRDQNLTVAELKEYRERLPNGLQDLNTIEQELGELGTIDNAFYQGNGGELINHMWSADPQATIKTLKAVPQLWARLDPDSYNEAFSAIIASTLSKDRIADVALRAYNRAKQAGDQAGQDDAADLYNYLQSFGKKAEDESPAAKRLREKEEAFNRTTQESAKRSAESFNATFIAESSKFQREAISQNPIFKKLPQGVSEAKKARMVDLIRSQITAHLQRSRAFMNQLTPAYNSMNLAKALEIQKGPQGWQPWIVNMYVRKVLAEETPGLIEGTNAANAKKRQAAARTGISNRAPAKQQTPAGKQDKRSRPSDFTMEEIMSGKVPEHIMDAYIANRGRR
jgi:hypothetical protein